MRRVSFVPTAPALLCGALCVLLLTGCDDPAATTLSTQQSDYNEVLAKVQEAERGFVSTEFAKDRPEGQKIDLDAYRAQKLAEADQAVAALLAKQIDSKPLHVAALRLRARLLSAEARRLTRDASTAYAELGSDSSGLTSELLKVARFHDVAARNDKQSDLTGLLSAIQANASDAQTQREAQEGEASGLSTQLNDARGKIAALQQQRDAARTRSTQLLLESRAAADDREKSKDLYIQGVQAEREASKAETEIETLRVTERDVQAKLAIVNQKVDLLTDAIGKVQQQAQEARSRASTAGGRKTAAMQLKTQAAADLKASFEAFMSAYEQRVQKPLTQAVAKLEEAKAALDKAQGMATLPRDEQRNIGADKLALHVDEAHALTQHATAIGGLGIAVELLDKRTDNLMPADAGEFQTRLTALSDEQTKLLEALEAEITAGLRTHAELAGGATDDAVAKAAAAQRQALESFRANAANLPIGSSGQAVVSTLRPSNGAATPVAPAPGVAPGAPAGGVDPDTVQAITGSIPAIPAEAVQADTAALIWIDGTQLTPQALKANAIMLLGQPMVQQMQLNEKAFMPFAGMYKQFADAGGTSLLLSAAAPDPATGESPDPLLFVSMRSGADDAGMRALLTQLSQEGPPTFARSGDWLIGAPPNVPLPQAGGADAARAGQFAAAFNSQPGAPIRVAAVLNEAMREQAKAMAQGGPGSPVPADADKLTPYMEQAEWFALSLRLGNQIGIHSSTKLPDAATATEAATVVEEMVADLSQPPDPNAAPNPLAGIGPLLQEALQVRANGDQLEVSLAGDGLRNLVINATSNPLLLPMLLGGGEGPGAPPPGFDPNN